MSDKPIKQPASFSNKVTTSAFWIFLFQIQDNVLGFVRLLILARLLTPNDFGLVAVAWLVLQTIAAFTQTGIQQTLIHKPHIDKYLNTAWTYLVIRGLFLYGILFLCSSLLGTFFNTTASISIIKTVGLTLVFEGFVNIGVIFFQKDLNFNKEFIFQISGNLVDFVVAVTLAFILKDVRAIVYGSLANSVAKLILSYILSNYRPKLEFNFKIYKELNSYGKWIASSNVLQFIYSQGDDLLVGRLLGTASLGLYQLAYRISNLPATQITHLVTTIMFPAYSNIQSDLKRISRIYVSVLQIITFLSFFVGTIIICFAYDFTNLFLGVKWLPMVPAMQLLTIWGIMRSIGATTGPVWQALGTPKTVAKIQSLQVIILVLIIYPLTVLWKISGTSLAVVISAVIPNIIAIIVISRTLSIKLRIIINELLIPIFVCFIIAAALFVGHFFIRDISFIVFFLFAIICTILYLGYSFILSKYLGYKLYSNLITLFKNRFSGEKELKIISQIENLIV